MPIDLLAGLNDSQREAVTTEGGPLLVLAGAGSGKTRVITRRIAHLIRERGVAPAAIIAVTFTNKAAREMMERVAQLLGLPQEMSPWSPGTPRLGTFHGFCLRLLRREAELLGYKSGFVVYDADDSKGLIKACLKELQIDDKTYPPGRVLARIGAAKDRLRTPKQVLEAAGDLAGETMGKLYLRYQQRLRQATAMDFDDLIMKTLELFRDHPERRDEHAGNCHHLLVDEFQDTNQSQYRLVRELASIHGNVCVVGDEDQSIYRFRGADIANILNFEKDFKGTRLVRLERNYRSTQNILAAA
ncbi:MAG: UvrD-helicase domain-containing protein, partial [Acidobacteria bacterium]|nr:UvrD-helicase domain-containing protein [Acidobacteriota bacterium]